jgi:hypothetical protein
MNSIREGKSLNTGVIILCLVIFVIIMIMLSNRNKEDFKPWEPIINNQDGKAYLLEYGETEAEPLNPKGDNSVMGPNSDFGVNQNNITYVYDKDIFKWTENAKNPLVDEITDQYDNQQLRNNFERTYMLDPKGDTAKYDITYNTISPNCCPAQYAPPFPLSKNNCDYAQKYVANQYSGMNFKDGYGCTCMTIDQAKFFGNRGNNTE